MFVWPKNLFGFCSQALQFLVARRSVEGAKKMSEHCYRCHRVG